MGCGSSKEDAKKLANDIIDAEDEPHVRFAAPLKKAPSRGNLARIDETAAGAKRTPLMRKDSKTGEALNISGDDDSGERRDLGVALGIDLGTTFSCVGVMIDGRVVICEDDEGKLLPSYVSFTQDANPLTPRWTVGRAAKQSAKENPLNTVFDAKRLIGRKYSDAVCRMEAERLPFSVVPADGDKAAIAVSVAGMPKVCPPEEIASMVLSKIKRVAKAYLDERGLPITGPVHAVVTVPAYFNDMQREMTKHAGQLAGLNVLSIVDEPTAAAMAYGLDTRGTGRRKILIFDFGGGTFDVTVLTLTAKGLFKVQAIDGDGHLGGQDLDASVIEHCRQQMKQAGVSLGEGEVEQGNLNRLRQACEQAKIRLSSTDTTELAVPLEGASVAEWTTTLTRAQFESLNAALFARLMAPVKNALKEAGKGSGDWTVGDIDDVVLVGGSTRVPRVKEMLTQYFGKKPLDSIDPDEAVAAGAAVHATMLANNQANIDAMGGRMRLMNVVPLSLGIATEGDRMSTLIKRNTGIPTSESKIYQTTEDNQEVIVIRVHQGESAKASENVLIGEYPVRGFPAVPLSKGGVEIEVEFSMDDQGIFTMSARDCDAPDVELNVIIEQDKMRMSEEQIAELARNNEQCEGSAPRPPLPPAPSEREPPPTPDTSLTVDTAIFCACGRAES